MRLKTQIPKADDGAGEDFKKFSEEGIAAGQSFLTSSQYSVQPVNV
jgi:hypothetical protein